VAALGAALNGLIARRIVARRSRHRSAASAASSARRKRLGLGISSHRSLSGSRSRLVIGGIVAARK